MQPDNTFCRHANTGLILFSVSCFKRLSGSKIKDLQFQTLHRLATSIINTQQEPPSWVSGVTDSWTPLAITKDKEEERELSFIIFLNFPNTLLVFFFCEFFLLLPFVPLSLFYMTNPGNNDKINNWCHLENSLALWYFLRSIFGDVNHRMTKRAKYKPRL